MLVKTVKRQSTEASQMPKSENFPCPQDCEALSNLIIGVKVQKVTWTAGKRISENIRVNGDIICRNKVRHLRPYGRQQTLNQTYAFASSAACGHEKLGVDIFDGSVHLVPGCGNSVSVHCLCIFNGELGTLQEEVTDLTLLRWRGFSIWGSPDLY